jgi:hypothetical protein
MDGLTAKVFRTYNASITLQKQLQALTHGEQVPTPDIEPVRPPGLAPQELPVDCACSGACTRDELTGGGPVAVRLVERCLWLSPGELGGAGLQQ